MRKRFWANGAGLVVALGTLAAVAGCDTNYYGDSGTSRTTTTTTAAPPVQSQSSTTTTVAPNPDGSVTTTRQTTHQY
jgi:hypothetical protein